MGFGKSVSWHHQINVTPVPVAITPLPPAQPTSLLIAKITYLEHKPDYLNGATGTLGVGVAAKPLNSPECSLNTHSCGSWVVYALEGDASSSSSSKSSWRSEEHTSELQSRGH